MDCDKNQSLIHFEKIPTIKIIIYLGRAEALLLKHIALHYKYQLKKKKGKKFVPKGYNQRHLLYDKPKKTR